MAFTTMESVRKGRGLTPEMERPAQKQRAGVLRRLLQEDQVHVSQGARRGLRHDGACAWPGSRSNRPLEYYTTFYTVRADNFDAILMLRDPEELDAEMKRIDKLGKHERTAKDDDTYTLLELVYEMRARGIEFLPVDLYKSSADEFLIQEGKIRPPFNRLPGVGGAAAETLYAACQEAVKENRPFISVEDLKARAAASSGTHRAAAPGPARCAAGRRPRR